MALLVACRVAMLTVAIVVAAPLGAIAQSLVCWPIARGDTASGLARRLTGDAAAAYGTGFQIRVPARGVFVPKSHYQRLSTDWQVCVAPEILIRSLPTPAVVTARDLAPPIVASQVQAAPTSSPTARRYDVGRAVFVGIAVALILLAGTVIVRLVPAPAAPPELQRAGEAFVGAFARPLIDPGLTVPPIAARLRFVRRSDQLEIYLAPGDGRRYPNLRDHKRNVEYDVHRVLHLLGPRVVVGSPVRAEGKWVVVPIRLIDRKGTGAA